MSTALIEKLTDYFAPTAVKSSCGQLTMEIPREQLLQVCNVLRDEPGFQFNQLIDLCGVDYSVYGVAEWQTESATSTGFERGVESISHKHTEQSSFAVVYHLLSTVLNQRLRLRTFVDSTDMLVDSVNAIWPSANWFEREAFDLFGILFKGHNDLRRILTDYGFIGHPFRKDFPLSGHVQVRYDAKKARVVYEPVDIEPRVLVPKVIRNDNRYLDIER